MPSLIWRDDAGKEQQVAITRRVTSIGASKNNDIVINAPDIESSHALIQFDGSHFFVQRLSHDAQCRVNGKKAKRAALEDGDALMFGSTPVHFRLLDAVDDAPEPPQTEQPSHDFEALLRFSHTLLEEQDLDALLEKLMDAIVSLTGAEKGFLLLADDTGQWKVRVARAIDNAAFTDGDDLYSDSIVQSVLQTRKALIVSDALRDSAFAASESVVNLRLCSVLCVPLIHHGDLLGLIYVGNDSVANLFRQEHKDTLTVFSAHAALIIRNAMLLENVREDNRVLKQRLETIHFGSIIGASDAMQTIYAQIERIAPTGVSVLIDGETGTGKELIAHEIHARSNRAKAPFITINCGAIPEALLESELFGHVRGAFTGAQQARAGRFQAADGGTLFLDEIGEMPLQLQVKILRALQERVVTRIGNHKEEPVDIRILAATNRDLAQEVKAGNFREDLYYRLNVMQLTLPPLRERGEDILLIAQYLLERYLQEFGVGSRQFGEEAKCALLQYHWPGNIRELDNHIKKAVILSQNRTLSADDLALQATTPEPLSPLQEARDAWQRQYIQRAVTQYGGNRTQAAKALGVDPRTIYRYLHGDANNDAN